MSNDLQDQLAKMRRESEERDAQRRATSAGLAYLPTSKISVSLDALSLIPLARAKEAQCAVIEEQSRKIALVAVDPQYSKTKEIVEELKQKGYTITAYVVSQSSLEYALGYYRFVAQKRGAISGSVHVDSKMEEGAPAADLSTLEKVRAVILQYNDPGKVSQLVEIILSGALASRASDVHFEPRKDSVRLRFRIDGVLNDVFDAIGNSIYRAVLSRIKLLANLKINVRDEPQDGRFTITLEGKNVEVRVAIAPSEFGEVVVMRLLDPDAISLKLEDLGIRKDDLAIIQDQLSRPNGMALNTGPTGSGKTTTLYAFLKHKLDPGIKIITIEDPIEYHLDGIEQTQVDNEAGYSFASGLRSLMRQDPDVILVGEIRDKETAEIAVQAALTGHLVFSTVHANSASAGIPRLLDLGVKAVSLAPALNLLIAQRLVRRLCAKCRVTKQLTPEERTRIEQLVNSLPDRVAKEEYLKNITLFEPKGCEACNNTGYRGRVGLYELLVITPALQELITKQAGQIEIEKVIATTDFVSMQQDGALKVISGLTTFEEIEGVTGKIVWNNSKK